MVAPLLLGILGAGLASQAAVHGWAIPEYEKRQGKRAGGILDELDPSANIDQKREALMRGGLLSPRDFAQIGFEDQASNRDFFEQLRATQSQYDLMDRNNQNERDWRSGENAANRAFAANQNQLDRDEERAVYDAEKWRADDETFWATQNALEASVAPVNQNIEMRNRALEIVNELTAEGNAARVISPQEQNRLLFELSEIDEILFFDYKKQVYGDAEPPPAVLEQLRQAYPTFSQQPRRRWNETAEQYNRRNQADFDAVQGAISKAQETVERLNRPYGTTQWSLGAGNQFSTQPRTSGGAIPDSEVVVD